MQACWELSGSGRRAGSGDSGWPGSQGREGSKKEAYRKRHWWWGRARGQRVFLPSLPWLFPPPRMLFPSICKCVVRPSRCLMAPAHHPTRCPTCHPRSPVSCLPHCVGAPLGWPVPADAQLAQKARHRPTNGGLGLVLPTPASSPCFFLWPPGKTLSPRGHMCVALPAVRQEQRRGGRRPWTQGFLLSGSGPSIAVAQ